MGVGKKAKDVLEDRARACVEPSGKPRRNDAGLRVKIRRLSWLAAETAVAVYLNTPRPPGPQPPPQQLLCPLLNVRASRAAKKRTLHPSQRRGGVSRFLHIHIYWTLVLATYTLVGGEGVGRDANTDEGWERVVIVRRVDI